MSKELVQTLKSEDELLDTLKEQVINADKLRGWVIRLLALLVNDQIKITTSKPDLYKDFVDYYNRIVDLISSSGLKKINVNQSVAQSAFSKEAMEKKQYEMYGIFKTKKEKIHTIENYFEELKLNEVEKKLIVDLLVLTDKSLKTNINTTSINNILSDDNCTIKEYIDSKVQLIRDAKQNEQTRNKK